MDRKGQVTIGALIMVFVVVIVGVAFLTGGIASNVAQTRTLSSVANSTITSDAINVTVEMPGSGYTDTPIIINSSGDELTVTTDYVTESRAAPVTSGVVTNTFIPRTADGASQSINVSYTSEPDGYDTSSGGRAIILLVIIFATLAIAVVALVPALRSGVMELFKG